MVRARAHSHSVAHVVTQEIDIAFVVCPSATLLGQLVPREAEVERRARPACADVRVVNDNRARLAHAFEEVTAFGS